MKVKTVVIALAATAVAVGGIAAGIRYSMQARIKPVNVVSMDKLNQGEWIGDTSTSYGSIVSRNSQNVQLDMEKELAKVYVKTGDQVKIGDPLLEYDMTLQELQREMADLTKQTQELTLADMKRELNKLRNTRVTASLSVSAGTMTASADSLLEDSGGETIAQDGPSLEDVFDSGDNLSADGLFEDDGIISDGLPGDMPGGETDLTEEPTEGEIVMPDDLTGGGQTEGAGGGELLPPGGLHGGLVTEEPGAEEPSTGETQENPPPPHDLLPDGSEILDPGSTGDDSLLESEEPSQSPGDVLVNQEEQKAPDDLIAPEEEERILTVVNQFLTRVNQLSIQELDQLIPSDISEALRIYREELSGIQEAEFTDVLGEKRVWTVYTLKKEVADVVGESAADVLSQAYNRACVYQLIYLMGQLETGAAPGDYEDTYETEMPREEGPVNPDEETSETSGEIGEIEETESEGPVGPEDMDLDSVRFLEESIREAVDAFYQMQDRHFGNYLAALVTERKKEAKKELEELRTGDFSSYLLVTDPEDPPVLLDLLDTLADYVRQLNRADVLEETESESEPFTDMEPPDDYEDPGDYGESYTAEELQAAIAQQELEIKEQELEIRESELQIQEYDRELDNRIVRSTMDGVVVSAGTMEDSLVEDSFIVISGKTGLFLRGVLDELKLDSVKVGDTVTGTSYETGMTFSATITEISPYPASDSGYYYSYGQNTNSSSYPFFAYIEDSEGLAEGDVEFQFEQKTPTTGIYIEKMLIREDPDGREYVYRQGDDGLLEKQYVRSGAVYYGYIEVREGLDLDDKLAFPYGRDVFEGAQTTEVDSFYGGYYG